MRGILTGFATFFAVLGLLTFTDPVMAQKKPTSVSIYTYRIVTNRLTNEKERLSNELVVQSQRASSADNRWRDAQNELIKARRSGQASTLRIAEMEAQANEVRIEFEAAIDDLNAQLAQQDAETDRLLRAATAAGHELLLSQAGQQALALIALGGLENNEAALQILLEEQRIGDRVDRLRIADRARSLAVTILGLRGTAPSASTAKLIEQYEKVVTNDPDNHWDWVELGNVYLEAGRLPDARRAALQSLSTAKTQRDLSVSFEKMGDVQIEQGETAAALDSYRQSLVIAKALTKADPTSATLQRDLALNYSKVGNVQLAQGEITAALASYRQSLAITQTLTNTDPTSDVLQRDLAVNYSKVGEAQLSEGETAAALASYGQSLAIAETLTQANPTSVVLQRDLFVSHSKVGEVQFARGDIAAAFESYRQSLGIAEALTQADPTSATLQRDLAVSHSKVGNVQLAQGDTAAALASYRQSLAIIETLTNTDPTSAVLQRDLSVRYAQIGDVQVERGETYSALVSYRHSLAIIEILAKADPLSAELQRDLASGYGKLALLGDPSYPWTRVVAKMEAMSAAGMLLPRHEMFLIEARRLADEAAATSRVDAVP